MASVYPKLRADLIVSRQEKPGGVAYVVKDPVVGRFVRFKEPEYFIARQLDGVTSLEEIRRRGEEELGASLSQATMEQFAGKLATLGLLEIKTGTGSSAPPPANAGRVRGQLLHPPCQPFQPDRMV